MAYSAATGARLWARTYIGPDNPPTSMFGNSAGSLAVSPDGSRVYVTGRSHGGARTGNDYATIAYSAATGTQLWVKRYNGPANGGDAASAITVSPTGRVLVTGSSYGGASRGNDYATIAYRGATGTREWLRFYNSPTPPEYPQVSDDQAADLAVSPTGSGVFVTWESSAVTGTSGTDYLTVAYRG